MILKLINLLKSHDYFMYRHVTIQHGSHIVIMCFAWISEQTETFALHNISRLVLYNQGGEHLPCSTNWVII
jgi:hypothetical protein